LPFVELRIECKEAELVFAVPKLRQDGIVRLARYRNLGTDPHAAAHVDEHRHADRRSTIRSQRKNRARLTVVANLEVRRG
jgi:hypothetical protein